MADDEKVVEYVMWPSSLKRAGHTIVRVSDKSDQSLFEALAAIPINDRYGMAMGRRTKLPCKLIPSSPFWSGRPREWCQVHQGVCGRVGGPIAVETNKSSEADSSTLSSKNNKRCSEADGLVDFIRAADIPVFTLVAPRIVGSSDDTLVGAKDDGITSSPSALQLPRGDDDPAEIAHDEEYCDIGVWIGLAPAIDTLNEGGKNFYSGIHVHARKTMDGKKLVDKNFPAVHIRDKTGRFPRIPDEGFLITPPTALELLYVMEHTCPISKKMREEESTSSGGQLMYQKSGPVEDDYMPRPLVTLADNLRCQHCQTLHEDIGDIFGETPHQKHLCSQCGRFTTFKEAGIGNPLAAFLRVDNNDAADTCLRAMPVRELVEVRDPHLSELRISTHGDQEGQGKLKVMIWPSTPAIFWSREAPEIWGTHVHAFDSETGTRVVDDTFGRVLLDGWELNRLALFRDMLAHSEWVAEARTENAGEIGFAENEAEELEDD